MSFPEHGAELGWVAEVLSWEDITWDDLQGGFVFLQIISVLSPQAVDLSWYSSAAALECSNTSVQIKADLITGLRCLGLSDEQIPEATVDCVIDGDIKASCEVVGALRRMRADLEATRKSSLAPTPDLSAGARSESGLKERVDHGLGEFMGDGDGVSGDEWYEAAELSFKPALRWLCLHVNAHILETTAPSAIIEGFLVELDDPQGNLTLLPRGTLISALRGGDLYQRAASIIFDDSTSNYLDLLTRHGYLKFKASLRNSISDMIADDTPFYESIHCNLIEALLAASCKDLGIPDVVNHIRQYFPHFPLAANYPYDVEDALVMWINLCLSTARKIKLQQHPTIPREIDTLGTGLMSGHVLCVAAQLYFPSHKAGKPSKERSWEYFTALCERIPEMTITWNAAELWEYATRASADTGPLRLVLLAIVVALFGACQGRKPVTKAESEVEAAAEYVAEDTHADELSEAVTAIADHSLKAALPSNLQADAPASVCSDAGIAKPSATKLAEHQGNDINRAADAKANGSRKKGKTAKTDSAEKSSTRKDKEAPKVTDAPTAHSIGKISPQQNNSRANSARKPAAAVLPSGKSLTPKNLESQSNDIAASAKAFLTVPHADGNPSRRSSAANISTVRSAHSRAHELNAHGMEPESQEVVEDMLSDAVISNQLLNSPIAPGTQTNESRETHIDHVQGRSHANADTAVNDDSQNDESESIITETQKYSAVAVVSRARDQDSDTLSSSPSSRANPPPQLSIDKPPDGPQHLAIARDTKADLTKSAASTHTPSKSDIAGAWLQHASTTLETHKTSVEARPSAQVFRTPMRYTSDPDNQDDASVIMKQQSALVAEEWLDGARFEVGAHYETPDREDEDEDVDEDADFGLDDMPIFTPTRLPGSSQPMIIEETDVLFSTSTEVPLVAECSKAVTIAIDETYDDSTERMSHEPFDRGQDLATSSSNRPREDSSEAATAGQGRWLKPHVEPSKFVITQRRKSQASPSRAQETATLLPQREKPVLKDLMKSHAPKSQPKTIEDEMRDAAIPQNVNRKASEVSPKTNDGVTSNRTLTNSRRQPLESLKKPAGTPISSPKDQKVTPSNKLSFASRGAAPFWPARNPVPVQAGFQSQEDPGASDDKGWVTEEENFGETARRLDEESLSETQEVSEEEEEGWSTEEEIATPSLQNRRSHRALNTKTFASRSRPAASLRAKRKEGVDDSARASLHASPRESLRSTPRLGRSRRLSCVSPTGSKAEILELMNNETITKQSSPIAPAAGHALPTSSRPTERYILGLEKKGIVHGRQTRPVSGLQFYPLDESESSSSSDGEACLEPEHPDPLAENQQTRPGGDESQKGDSIIAVTATGTKPVDSGPKVQKPMDRREEQKAKKLNALRRMEAAREAGVHQKAQSKQEEKEKREALRRQSLELQAQKLEERSRQLASKRAAERERQERSCAETPPSRAAIAPAAESATPVQADNDSLATCAAKRSVLRRTPTKEQSNRQLIRNALVHVCLAGSVNEKCQAEVLEDLATTDASHFVILFHAPSTQTFRGLYSYDPHLDQALKIYPGTQGPDVLDTNEVLAYYKYDSGARIFKPVPTKSFGRSVHAVAIGREWGTKKLQSTTVKTKKRTSSVVAVAKVPVC